MNGKILILFLLTIAQLYAQTCFGIASTDNSVCSSAGACVADDKCSCYSGYDGMECAHKAPSSCTFNNNTMTKTDFYPFLDSQSISFDNNNLKLVIQAPLVNDRLDTKIYIQNNTFTDCAYPGNHTGNYLDEAGVCYNRFNYTLPWAAGKNCGWELTENDDQQTYTGNMYIEQKENLGTVRGQPIQRTIKSVLPLTVTFQKRVSVVTSIKVYSPVALISAVTKQQYIAGPPKAGLIEFITSLQYPFQIDTAQTLSVHTFPAGIVPTLRNVSENCLLDQPCTQTFEMDLAVGAACSFTGLYKATFLLKCHPSIQDPLDCPLDTNRNVDVEFNVNSENFCSVVAVNINLQGTLKAYQEVGHTTRKTAFLIGQTAYFNAETSSTQATLQESKLVRVQWSNENITKVLYDNFTITADGTTESFAVGTFGANSAAFQFNLLDSSMNIPTDSNLNFTISALLEIKYQSISGNSETAYKETTFSIKDRKQLLSSVAPVEGHQRSKFSETIKVFGHYKPVSESGSISFSLILLISFAFFTLF